MKPTVGDALGDYLHPHGVTAPDDRRQALGAAVIMAFVQALASSAGDAAEAGLLLSPIVPPALRAVITAMLAFIGEPCRVESSLDGGAPDCFTT